MELKRKGLSAKIFYRYGAVAQLGERLVRNEEVASSILVSSTKLDGGRTAAVWGLLYNGTSGLGLDSSYLFRHQTKKAD